MSYGAVTMREAVHPPPELWRGDDARGGSSPALRRLSDVGRLTALPGTRRLHRAGVGLAGRGRSSAWLA